MLKVIHPHGSWKGGGPLEEDLVMQHSSTSSLGWLLEDSIANQHLTCCHFTVEELLLLTYFPKY